MSTEILALRTEIDNIDKEVLQLLEDRFEIVKEIGEVKKADVIEVKDNEREQQLLESRILETGMNQKFVTRLFSTILEESRRLQSE